MVKSEALEPGGNDSGNRCWAVDDASGAAREPADGRPLTTMEWDVRPKSLYWGPRVLFERYNLPIVIAENGMAKCDWIHVDSRAHDSQRRGQSCNDLGSLICNLQCGHF